MYRHSKELYAAAVMMPFSKRFVALAQAALNKLKEHNMGDFNGAHLRLELDSISRARFSGGFEGLLDIYARSLRAARANASLPLYIASGITSGGKEWERTKQVLLGRSTSKIVFLGNLISPVDLETIPQEQIAIADMLILIASNVFVGINYSTFSVYAAIIRTRLGHSYDSSVLVSLPKEHHEGLMRFTRAGSFMTGIREMSLE